MIAGTITLGAMVTFDGGQTLQDAGDKISQQAEKLQIFAGNQTKLVDSINSMKSQVATLSTKRDELQAQVDDLIANGTTDQETIDKLNGDIADLEAQIVEQRTRKLLTLKIPQTTVMKQLNVLTHLKQKLKNANAKAAELQATIDENDTSDIQPLTDEEIAELTDGQTETVPERYPVEEPVANYDKELLMATALPQDIAEYDFRI